MARGFNLTAEINLRGPSNIRTIVADIRRQLGTVTADVDVRINPGVGRNINTLNQALQRLNTNLQNTRTFSNQAVNALNSLANIGNRVNSTISTLPRNVQAASTAVNTLTRNTNNTAQAAQAARTEFEEFGRQSALAVRRFAAFAFVTSAIYKLNNAIGSGAKQFVTFNKELVRVSQVTGTSVKNLDFLVSGITNLSTSLGVTSEELIGVSATLAQAGLSARDTEKALKALALSALAPSFDNLANTVEGSIALMRQFGISAGDLEKALGSVNAVAAKFAVEAGDIIAAVQRTGGVFAAASRGVSEGTDALNEFIAVFTSVRATTRESAETIATGLRTIFTRIQRTDTIDALKEYGVVLTDLSGKFVGPYEAVRRLAEGLNLLDPRDLRFARIVEELGGFRQIGKVIPLIQQFTTAQQALIVAQRGQGSLATDAAVAQQALAVKISKVREEFVALIRSIGQSEGFQNFIGLSLDLASGLIKLADAAKNVLPALTAIAAIRGTSFLAQFATGFLGGIRRSNTGTRRFATGGYVPGTGNRDTVPAMLTPGEFVIRKKAVEKIGVGRLAAINRNGGGPVPTQYFANGGEVQRFMAGKFVMPKGRGKKGAKGTRGPKGFKPMSDAEYAKWSRDIYAEWDNNPDLPREKYMGIPMPKPIAEYQKKIREYSLVSGAGLALGKDDKGREVIAKFGRAKAATEKRARKVSARTLRSFAKAGSEAVDTDAVNAAVESMTAEDIQKTLGSSMKRAPAGRYLEIEKEYNKDPEFRKLMGLETGVSGNFLKQFEAQAKQKVFTSPKPLIDKIPGAKARLESFRAELTQELSRLSGLEQTKEIQKEIKTIRDQIKKSTTAIDDFDDYASGKSPGVTGRASHFAWAMRQAIPEASMFASGGNVQKFAVGGEALRERMTREERILKGMDAGKTKRGRQIYKFGVAALRAGSGKKEDVSLSRAPSGGKISANLSKPFRIPGDPPKIGMFKIGTLAESGLDTIIETKLQEGFVQSVTDAANVMSAKIGGSPFSTPSVLNKIFKGSGFQSVIGSGLEAAIGMVGSPYIDKTEATKSFDFPLGLGRAASLFNIPSDIPTDATRTIGGFGKGRTKLVDAARRFVEAVENKKFTEARVAKTQKRSAQMQSGDILSLLNDKLKGTTSGTAMTPQEIAQRFNETRAAVYPDLFRVGKTGQSLELTAKEVNQAIKSKNLSGLFKRFGDPSGVRKVFRAFNKGGSAQDTVPALLTPGEFVINKRAARSIGAARLNKLNHADKIKGFNKGGSVGYIQKFAKGGTPEKLAEAVGVSPAIPSSSTASYSVTNPASGATINVSPLTRAASEVEQALEALVNNVGNATSRVVGKITKDPLDIKGYAKTEKEVQTALNPQAALGLRQAADTGDQNAANMVADIQKKQVNSIVKVIRVHDNSVSVTQAKAAAERRVLDAWGGLYKRTKEQEKQSSLLSRAMSKATNIYNRIRGNTPGMSDDERNERRQRREARNNRISQMGMGLAFTAPMIADQIGQVIGGSKGSGISEATASFSTFAGIGSQFGIIGTFAGALVGAVAAVDSYTKGVLKAENELSATNIEKEAEKAEKNVGRLEKDPRNKALTDSIVNSIDKMSSSEAEIQARNVKLREPTTLGRIGAGLQTAASYATFGLVSEGRAGPPKMGTPEYDKFITEIGQANAAQSKARADIAIKSLSAKGSTGLTIEQALGTFGSDAGKIQESIAAGNVEYATELEKLTQLAGIGAISASELEQRKKGLIQKYYLQETEGLKAAMADKARAMAAQKVAKALNIAVTSIDRTFGNMEAALNRGADALSQASTNIEAAASDRSVLQASFGGQNVLENPRAYSRRERRTAVQQASSIFGGDSRFVEQLAGSTGTQIKDALTSIGAQAQSTGASKEATAQEVQRTVDRLLQSSFGNNDLTRQLSEQVRIAIQDQLKNEETSEFDIDKLLSESAGLTSLIESEKKAFELLAQATKQASQAIDLYSNQVSKATDMLNEIDTLRGESVASRASNDFRLREMFGGRISIRERLSARREEAAARSGIKPDQLNLNFLTSRLQTLQQTRAGTQTRRTDFQTGKDFTDPATIQGINNFNSSLIKLDNEISKTKNAIKSLPKDIQGAIDDVANTIQERISKIETQRQAGAAFAEGLVTSTPEELTNLNNTYNILNGALNGQVRTIQQSIAAQQAYQKVVQDGGTAVEAMSAAQNAFANENKQAFSMFSELIDVAGIDKQQANTMRADVLESMARSQGMNIQNNPIFNKIIENLRRPPQDDPEIKRLQDLYRNLQAAQKDAFEASMKLVFDDATNLIKLAGTEVSKAIQQSRISFNEQQLADMGLGLSRPAQVMGKSDGGVVYASTGKLINFKPKGTDTVPAMLTPGEFVVNAQATKQNLPLLQAINKSSGGKVQYFNAGTKNPVTASRTPSIYDADYVDYVTEKFKNTPLYDEAKKLAAVQQLAYSRLNASIDNTAQRADADSNWKKFVEDARKNGVIGSAATTSSTPQTAAALKPPTPTAPTLASQSASARFTTPRTATKPQTPVSAAQNVTQQIDDMIDDMIQSSSGSSANPLSSLSPSSNRDIRNMLGITTSDRIADIQLEVVEKWNAIRASASGANTPIDDLRRGMRQDFADRLVAEGIVDSSDAVRFRRPITGASEPFRDIYEGFSGTGASNARGGRRSRVLPTSASARQRLGAFAGDTAESVRGFGSRIGSGIGSARRMLGSGVSAVSNYAGSVSRFANMPFQGANAAETFLPRFGQAGQLGRGVTRLGLGATKVGWDLGVNTVRAGRTIGTSLLPTLALNSASEMLGFGSLSNEAATMASFGIDALQGGARSLLTSPFSTSGSRIPAPALAKQAGRLATANKYLPRVGPGFNPRFAGTSGIDRAVGRAFGAARNTRVGAGVARAASTVGNIGGGGVGRAVTGARLASGSAIAVNTALSAITEGVSFLYDREGYSNRLAAEEESEYANAKDQSGIRYAAGQAVSGFINPFRMFAKFGRAAYSTSQAAADNQAAQQVNDARIAQQREAWSLGGRMQPLGDNRILDTSTNKVYDLNKPKDAASFNNIISNNALAGFGLTGIETGWVRAQARFEENLAKGFVLKRKTDSQGRDIYEKIPINTPEGQKEVDAQVADLNARRDAKTQRYNRGYVYNTITEEKLMQSDNLDEAVIAQRRAMQQEEARKQAEAKEIARQQKIAQEAETFVQGIETAGNVVMSGIGFVSGLWNQGSSFLATRREQAAEKSRKEEVQRLSDLSEQASKALQSPALPEYVNDFQKYSENRSNLFKRLKELNETQLGGTYGSQEREEAEASLRAEKLDIQRQIIELNSTIVKKQREGTQIPIEERQQQWTKYNKKIATDQIKQENREKKLAERKEAALYANLEKVTRMRIPQDPEKLASWRAKALEKIRQKFDLTGDPSADIDMMTAYGLSPDLAKNLFRPMTEQQNQAVYDLLSQQRQGGEYKYSDQDLQLLRMSRQELIKRVSDGRVARPQDLIKRKEQLETTREREFGKSIKAMSRIDMLAQRGMNADPRAQARFRKNIYKKLVKSGFIDPRDNAQTNAQRLSSLNMGANTVSFIYPNQAGGMLAQMKSSGGIIYASAGKLINFQPKGTDTVPAMLTPGEFVVNARATKQHLPMLQAINKADGGFIGSTEGTVVSNKVRTDQSQLATQQKTLDNIHKIDTRTSKIEAASNDIKHKQLPSLTNQGNTFSQNTNKSISSLYDLSNQNLTRTDNVASYLDKNDVGSKLDSIMGYSQTAATMSTAANVLLMDMQRANIQGLPPEQLRALDRGLNVVREGLGAMFGNMFSRGGMVYASNGMLIPYKPRGTDTVPAMLTPGEFVVNARATKQHLPLLKSINSGIQQFATGGVVYAEDGAQIPSKKRLPYKPRVGPLPYKERTGPLPKSPRDMYLEREIMIMGGELTQKTSSLSRLEALEQLSQLNDKELYSKLSSQEELKKKELEAIIRSKSTQSKRYSRGGPIYASKGTLINFQSRGTDTVPAMLTPGEFVVNRSATQANLPLLKAINGGAKSFSAGGQVNYMADGGLLGQMFKPVMSSFASLTSSISNTVQALQNYQKQLAGTQPNSVSNSSGTSINLDGLSQFTSKFDQFITALNNINIPPMVQLQVAPVTVNITGAEALVKALQGPMGDMLQSQIQQSFARLSANTEGAIPV